VGASLDFSVQFSVFSEDEPPAALLNQVPWRIAELLLVLAVANQIGPVRAPSFRFAKLANYGRLANLMDNLQTTATI
jgi:hypothetical protein